MRQMQILVEKYPAVAHVRTVIILCYVSAPLSRLCSCPGGGEGVLLSKRLLGMCRCMGSHFHNWTDYNGVTFLVELLEWGRTFSGFLG